MTVSVKVFRLVTAGAAAGGVAPAELLAAAGIEPRALADADRRFSRTSEARLWELAARATGDATFGLHLAERMTVDAFGALGFAIRSSATLGDAYARVIRYVRVLAEGPTLRLVLDGSVARVRHLPPSAAPSPSRHAVEFLIGSLVMVARHGLGPAFVPRAVTLRHAAPPRLDEHRRLLGPAVTFDAEHDEVVVDRARLDQRQAEAEPVLADILDRQLADQLAQVPVEEAPFLDRARAALAAGLDRGDEPTLATIADRLRLSPRSLQRRLQAEGHSLSRLLDEVRADLARRYLGEASDSIGEVAFRLGFSDVSTFHRAFKRWTGQTPAGFRRDRSAPTRAAHGA